MSSQLTALEHFNAANRADCRSSQAAVWISHSCPLVAVGLRDMLARLPRCTVKVWPTSTDNDALAAPPTNGSMIVVGDLAGVQRWTPETPKVLMQMRGADSDERLPSTRDGINAWLLIDCREEELLAAVGSLLHQSPDVPEPPRSRWPRGGMASAALRRVREHIELHLAERLDLAELASLANLSECHFSRAFKQSMGMPPHRYIMSRRVAVASERIRHTNECLRNIAVAVGFSDQSHFTRMFVELTGETPRDFRHRHR